MTRARALASSLAVCLLGCTHKPPECPPAVPLETIAETPPASPSFEESLRQFTLAQAVVTWIGPRDHTTPSLFFYTDRADMSPARFQAAPSPVPGVPSDALHLNDVSSWRGLEFTVGVDEFRRVIRSIAPPLPPGRPGVSGELLLTVALIVRGAVWVQSFVLGRTDEVLESSRHPWMGTTTPAVGSCGDIFERYSSPTVNRPDFARFFVSVALPTVREAVGP